MTDEPNIIAQQTGEAIRHASHCDRDPIECSYEALVGEFAEVRRGD